MTLFFSLLNSMRDAHMWMGVNPSSRAWETYHKSFFFLKKEWFFLSQNLSTANSAINMWIGLEIMHAIYAGILDVLILCRAYVDDVRSWLWQPCLVHKEVFLITCLAGHLIIRYMIQNWVKPLILSFLKNPSLHFPALWRLSITEDVSWLVGIDISMSHGPGVCCPRQ